MSEDSNKSGLDFIRSRIKDDIDNKSNNKLVITRFPPEPNGYLHIGHAKSICLNFEIAEQFEGICNLRFDDTNPVKENVEYVESIKKDINWLGFDWEDRLYYASDYFEELYNFAIKLIEQGKAYVDDLNAEQIKEYRGTLSEPGKESPYRERSISENLELFDKMKKGEFNEGECVLRAKIDMASGNMNMRDPVMYRIIKTKHHRAGNKWMIYPMYDWAHGQSDSLEGVTYSLCTLEFEDHRPLYNWFIENLGIHHPQQIEFARLNLSYTVLSKRVLSRLVAENYVSGWDDPRMPTLTGLKRRGYTPSCIKEFCNIVGVTKQNGVIDLALLEHTIRNELNKKALRVMCVLDPIKVVIVNYPEGVEEELDAVNNPEDEACGTRKVPFGREIYIERTDFMEDPPKKYFRLFPGNEVRLRYAYFIKCVDVIKDDKTGEIVEVHCTYDPSTKGGGAADGRKVKGTIHWVSVNRCIGAEIRLYDRLFTVPNPTSDKEKDFTDFLNPDSLKVIDGACLEPSLSYAEKGVSYQFERNGYFILDSEDTTSEKKVFNRTVTLRDSWAKMSK